MRTLALAVLLAIPLFAEDAAEEKPFKIDLRHAEVDCDAKKNGKACGEAAHWESVAGGEAVDQEKLLKALKEAAGKEKRVSEQTVSIGGPVDTPWARVQVAMNLCAVAGIYKIEWRATAAGGKVEAMPAWLPKDKGVFGDPVPNPILEEVRVFLKKDPKTGAIVQKVNAKVIEKDDELGDVIAERIEKFKSMKRPDTPVIIDPDGNVPWSEVIRVVSICRAKKLEHVDFAAPMPGTK